MKPRKPVSLFSLLLFKPARIAVCLLALLVLAVFAPLKSYILQWLIDAGSREEALRSLLLGVGVIAVSHGSEYIARALFARVSTQAVCDARARIAASLARRTPGQWLAEDTGSLQAALTTDMRLLFDDYFMGLFDLAMWGGMALVALAMLAHIAPELMLLALVFCMMPLIVPRLMSKPLGRGRKQFSEDTGRYTGLVGELLKGYEALLSAGGAAYFLRRHRDAALRNQDADHAMRRTMNVASILTSLCAWVPAILVLLCGVFMVFDGRITIGYLVTVYSLTSFVIAPFRCVSNAYVNIRASAPIRKRLEGLINEPAPEDGALDAPAGATISLRGLTYAYPGAASPALSDVTLTVRPGEKVLIAGPSGSGKSTVAKLLYRYDDAYSGQLDVGGVPLRDISRQHWYARAAMIPQTPFLFSDTIRNNLCLCRDHTDEEVQTAIGRAGLADFIAALPEGLDTPLTEGGRNLSGGQAQRIALARALLDRCELIISDEATSSLDIATTCAVMNSLCDLPCAVVAISHDLYGDALRRFDRICYLENGRLLEEGTLDELQALGGRFAALQRQMLAEAEGQ